VIRELPATICHVGPTVHPDEEAMGLTVIEAAQTTGDKLLTAGG
jgi:hypothetical protein